MLRTITKYHDNGNIMERYSQNVTNNLKDGIYKNFYENGNTKVDSIYKNGKLHGNTYKYYDNQVIKECLQYKDEKLHGLCLIFYDNGNIKESMFFKKGKLHGQLFKFYENQDYNLKSVYNYKFGKMHGECYQFYEDKINKNMHSLCYFKFGKKYGQSMKWDKKGNLRLIKNYSNNLLNGYYQKYNEKKELILSCCYYQNFLNGSYKKVHYKNNSVTTTEGVYVNNQKHGLEVISTNNIVNTIFRYSGGRLNGIQNIDNNINYYKNGILILKPEKKTDSCCICYEDNNYKTKCSHSICLNCVEKIKYNCPMCRQKF